MARSRRPQSQKQRAYNQRRHYAAVNRGNKTPDGLPAARCCSWWLLARCCSACRSRQMRCARP